MITSVAASEWRKLILGKLSELWTKDETVVWCVTYSAISKPVNIIVFSFVWISAACKSLQNIDVSLNKFGSTGTELLLRCLNLSRLLSINLSNTIDRTHHSQFMKHLCHYMSHVSMGTPVYALLELHGPSHCQHNATRVADCVRRILITNIMF